VEPKPTFLNKLSSFFNKNKVSADPRVEPEQQSPVAQATPPEWISIYGHGFHNGIYRIAEEKDAFPGFLEHSNELDKIIELQELNRMEVREYVDKWKAAEEEVKKITADKSTAKEKSDALLSRKEKVQADSGIISSRNRFLFELREQTTPEYGWVPAVLFLIAGCLFIWGDITVTTDITSIGFDMKREDGRMFAIGLALTAFLIKPLLDRMFEKPFQKAGFELKKMHKVLLIIITVLGLVMLFFLGEFRAEAKTAINNLAANSTLQEKEAITPTELFELRSKADLITTQLAENWWGRWGMVLSAIVFAIGGAMCLSTAFPSLTKLANRYWFIPFRRWVNKFFIRKKEKTILKLDSELLANRTVLTQAESRLSYIDIPATYEKMIEAQKVQHQLITSYYAMRQLKETDLYRDGYNRGDKYTLEGDLKFKIIDPMLLNKNNGPGSDIDRSDDNESRKYTRRPFVKIRKMIADNYNKKQNNTHQDDTEFEILS